MLLKKLQNWIAPALFGAAAAISANLALAETPYSDPAYVQRMQSIGNAIKADPDYVRLPIDTNAQNEAFAHLSYELFSGKIQESEFVAKLTEQYPDAKYEKTILWLAKQLLPK